MRWRYLALGIGVSIVFAVVALGMLRILPQPLRPVDFMIAGAVGTMVALVTLFLALISTSMKQRHVFFKRRDVESKPDEQR